MSTRSRLSFLKLGQSGTRPREVYTVAMMGAEDVGKTALAVRYLTKKYLPEYSHSGTTCYERCVNVDDKIVPLRLIDTSGKESFTSLKSRGALDGTDGSIVVYSITDKRSFLRARELLKLVHEELAGSEQMPTTLIGSKDDLVHLRNVSTTDGRRVALTYPRCSFHECSAAREAENVEQVIHDFLRQVIQSKDGRRHLPAFSSLTLKPPNPRRYSAGNSTLSTWWRRPRMGSVSENRQDRTFTM